MHPAERLLGLLVHGSTPLVDGALPLAGASGLDLIDRRSFRCIELVAVVVRLPRLRQPAAQRLRRILRLRLIGWPPPQETPERDDPESARDSRQ